MGWFRRRNSTRWPLDPEKAEFGSLAAYGEDANRECVAVIYRGEREFRCVAISEFVRETRAQLKEGRQLDVLRVRIAPIARRRFAGFFDDLTDWSSATARARSRVDRAQKKLSRVLNEYSL